MGQKGCGYGQNRSPLYEDGVLRKGMLAKNATLRPALTTALSFFSTSAIRESLDFFPEVRLMVELRAAAYKDRISKAYNKKVWERPLYVNDLILLITAATRKAHAEEKLTAN